MGVAHDGVLRESQVALVAPVPSLIPHNWAAAAEALSAVAPGLAWNVAPVAGASRRAMAEAPSAKAAKTPSGTSCVTHLLLRRRRTPVGRYHACGDCIGESLSRASKHMLVWVTLFAETITVPGMLGPDSGPCMYI
jgi:hypothetical protein